MMSARVDIIGCDIAESFMIASVVLILNECFDRFLQFAWHLIGYEVNLSLD